MTIFNRYIYYFLFLSFLFSGNADHLIFNKVAISATQVEMIEIYNPLDSSLDLSNYYLSDSDKYYQWVHGESIGNFDFLIKFPTDLTIHPQESIVITTASSSSFSDYYGYEADISLIDTNFEIFEFGISPNLSPTEEMLILFYWDGDSSIIQDVDYFLWGDNNSGVYKNTDEGYTYNDTPLEDQVFLETYSFSDSYQYDSLYVRVNTDEYNEIQFDGNGITGHDETSEILDSSWMIGTYELQFPDSFQDIIAGGYDCGGSSQDGCPIGNIDCPIVSPTGMIVDYFDITQFNGPHALTIEDEDGYRLEFTIWPDQWDIANDPDYSNLLEPPYNRFLVKGYGSVFEYNGEKQILICGSQDFKIIESYDMDGIFEDFEDLNDNGQIDESEPISEQYLTEEECIEVLNTEGEQECEWTNEEPYEDLDGSNSYSSIEDFEDLNGNGIWDEDEDFEDSDQDGEYDAEEEPYEDLNDNNHWDEGFCYQDLNGNGIWDAIYEEFYDFNQASIDPVPYVLIASENERLDYSFSFPSNSRVIIRVFDVSGRFITTLIDKFYESSGIVKREELRSSWDGRNHVGQVLPPGTYLMHMEASNFYTGSTTTDIAPVVIGVRNK